MIKVLNLGAGVQSTTVLRLAIHGEIERPDYVIFADTGWEPKAVYEHLEILKLEMKANRIPFFSVSNGNLRDAELASEINDEERASGTGKTAFHMPLYSAGGMLRRSCTREFKIDPISKLMRQLCDVGRKTKNNCTPKVERWFGISMDEVQRMRLSAEWWAVNHYPLIELGMTRSDCVSWLLSRGYPHPPRSACIACPYRSDSEWRHLRDTSPEEFEAACRFDETIRNRGGVRGDIFVHRSGRPLRTVDLSTPEDHGQQNMWRDHECAGMCGV